MRRRTSREAKSSSRKSHVVGFTIGALFLALFATADAQQPKKVPQIGYLAAGAALSTSPRIELFRQAIRELGYTEGKDIVIQYRNAAGRIDQVAGNAVELVALKVDIIVTAGPSDTRAAKKATSVIPIVMTQDPDPVGNGFVASLAHPGGNITGLSRLARVAVFGSSTEPGNAQSLRERGLAAGAVGVKLQYLDLLSDEHIEIAFK